MADRTLLLALFVVCLTAEIISIQGTTSKTTTAASTMTTPVTTPKTTITTTHMPTTTESVEEVCAKHNGSCKDCVSNSKCLYCKSNDRCMKYPVGEVIPRGADCSLSDARWGVCWVNFEALLIAAGVIGGVIIISTIVCVYCCCCRSKGKRHQKDDAKYEQQKMERKVKQDERRTERKGRLDEIRRKYGLVKDDAPYNRFDA